MSGEFNEFESLVRRQDEANRRDGYANPRELRIEWEARAAQFIATIRGWIQDSAVGGLIHIEQLDEAVFDGSVGRFIAPSLLITIPSSRTFSVRVVGYCRAEIAPTDIGVPVEIRSPEDSSEWRVVRDNRILDRDAFAAILLSFVTDQSAVL